MSSEMMLEELELSVRAYNCLKRQGINTVEDLLDYIYKNGSFELLELRGMNEEARINVITALVKKGILSDDRYLHYEEWEGHEGEYSKVNIGELGLIFRGKTCLERVGISTIEKVLLKLRKEGVESFFKIRLFSLVAMYDLLLQLQRKGIYVDKYVKDYIEKDGVETSKASSWHTFYDALKLIRDKENQSKRSAGSCFITDLTDCSNILLIKLIQNNVLTVEELFERFDSVNQIENMQPTNRYELLKVLDCNGYRFSDCSKNEYVDIEEYAMPVLAEIYDFSDLKLDEEQIVMLRRINVVSVTQLVRKEIKDLKCIFDDKTIALLLRRLERLDLRMYNCYNDRYTDIEDAIEAQLVVSFSDLGFSSRAIKKLEANLITNLRSLLSFSRTELIDKKIVGEQLLNHITEVLFSNDLVLSEDNVVVCSNCDQTFVQEGSNDNTLCHACQKKKNRTKRCKRYTASLENPDYTSYTNGTRGFTLFLTLHNNSDKLVKAKISSFNACIRNREWMSTNTLTGYGGEDEYILPKGHKTIAKIWAGDQFGVMKFEKGDYVDAHFWIDGKLYIYQFTFNGYRFIFDDYYEV